MPSQRPSWFARHCAPPPPLGNSSACPCATCFNLPAPKPQPAPEFRRPSSMDSRAVSWRRSGPDAFFGSGGGAAQDTYTTTTHVEWVAK
ncbi:hypothetical protein CDD83_5524 [Cordyceps sp. RAO-2017]|nr:hypothetical protein CDD83_5524 [Cordyceps sp. RAO-2017]